MAKRVIKVQINGYYLVDEDLPEDVLGTATVEEYVQHGIAELLANYDAEDVIELVETMLEDMKTKPTVKLELKSDE